MDYEELNNFLSERFGTPLGDFRCYSHLGFCTAATSLTPQGVKTLAAAITLAEEAGFTAGTLRTYNGNKHGTRIRVNFTR